MAYNLETRSGHNMFTMASLLQKAIRRGDKERAGYAAMELFGSYHSMLWNRIMTVSCEDCWGILAKEIVALRYTDDVRNRNRKGYEKDTQYVSEAITLLCDATRTCLISMAQHRITRLHTPTSRNLWYRTSNSFDCMRETVCSLR